MNFTATLASPNILAFLELNSFRSIRQLCLYLYIAQKQPVGMEHLMATFEISYESILWEIRTLSDGIVSGTYQAPGKYLINWERAPGSKRKEKWATLSEAGEELYQEFVELVNRQGRLSRRPPNTLRE